jgi:hypothetical protein
VLAAPPLATQPDSLESLPVASPTQASNPVDTAAVSGQTRLQQARERRQRALQLYDEGAFDLSLVELRRAYELAPTYRLLYDIALLSLLVSDYAGAMDAFERYSREGGEAITTARRAAVEDKLRQLAAQVVVVDVRVNIDGARVFVDDRSQGISPLPAPLRMNAGFRRISAQAKGRLPDTRGIELRPGDQATIELSLATAAVDARLEPSMNSPASRVPWVAWGGTAVLVVAAAATGARALSAQHEYERLTRELGVTRQELDDVDQRAFHWSVAADVLGVSALALGIYATVITLRAAATENSQRRPDSETLGLSISPHSASVRLAF